MALEGTGSRPHSQSRTSCQGDWTIMANVLIGMARAAIATASGVTRSSGVLGNSMIHSTAGQWAIRPMEVVILLLYYEGTKTEGRTDMAKVYATPEGFDPPDFAASIVDGRYNMAKDDEIHADYIERLAEYCRSVNSGDLVGEVVRFPIADGCATYMVWAHRPFALLHLPIHDAWSIPEAHARGLRLSDIRDEIKRSKRIADLFSRKAAV